jgi:hypothetical protein
MKEPNDFSGFIVGFHAFVSLEEPPSHRIRFCVTLSNPSSCHQRASHNMSHRG